MQQFTTRMHQNALPDPLAELKHSTDSWLQKNGRRQVEEESKRVKEKRETKEEYKGGIASAK